jgi:hypothetical protein
MSSPLPSLLVPEQEINEVLLAVVRAIDGAAHASIVITPTPGRRLVLATTDPELDEALPPFHGPPDVAIAKRRISRIPSIRRCTEFPEYAQACASAGVFSVAAFPIRSIGTDGISALTVTSYDHHGFGTADLVLARAATARLSAAAA